MSRLQWKAMVMDRINKGLVRRIEELMEMEFPGGKGVPLVKLSDDPEQMLEELYVMLALTKYVKTAEAIKRLIEWLETELFIRAVDELSKKTEVYA